MIFQTEIVTLGPAGTFSELAALGLVRRKQLSATLTLKSDLASVIDSVQPGKLGLVPIENLTEGFVSPVVDGLVKRPLKIIAETTIPVEFQLVANHSEPEHLWAQFIAAGQCQQQLKRLNLPVIHTTSNSESLRKLMATESRAAALIPAHIECPDDLTVLVNQAADVSHNETRFVLLSAADNDTPFVDGVRWKSSVILVDDHDHPGLLVDSLSVFAQRGINLTSIVSRPTGGQFGQYHFFIDFDGHCQQPHVSQALTQLAKLNQVRWLGSYKAAE